MPSKTSSRRTGSRRNVAPDDIEEAHATQQSDQMDEDEEVPSHRSAKRVKKEKEKEKLSKRNSKGKETVQVEAGEDGEDDGQPEFEDFQNQALSKADAQKLKGLAQDWSQIRKGIHQPSFNQLKEIAVAMADAAEGDEREQCLAELDAIMRKLIDIDQEMIAHEMTLDDMHQLVVRGEPISDGLERYENGVKSKATEYDKKTSRQKYAKSEVYVSFKQGIFEVDNPNEAMPPITGEIPREDGDDSDDDDDLEIGGVTQDFKCPISLTTLENPMTAPCGHSFSEKAIKSFLAGTRGPKKCPGAGCNKSFTLAQLDPNPALARNIKLALRRAKRQGGDSDAEEVVE